MRMMVAVALALLAGLANGQDYPSRPIRLVVPYPTGGLTDVLARVDRLPEGARNRVRGRNAERIFNFM